jgi:ATP-binding cassette, subfamily C (CFTR/MRP), member 1
MVVLNSRGNSLHTKASAATAALSFLGTPFLLVLSYMEHNHTIHPSTALISYLGLAVLLDSVRVRTLWLSRNAPQAAGVLTAVLVLELIAFLLETLSKRRILRPEYTPAPSEGTSGIISRNNFWWVNPLFRKGYRQELAIEDLPVLDKQFDSRYLQELIYINWSRGMVLFSSCT